MLFYYTNIYDHVLEYIILYHTNYIRKYFNVLSCKNESNLHTETETETENESENESEFELVEEEPQKQTETFKFKKTIQVFTDGSSFNNGSKTKKHSGGIGVFFGKNHPDNKSIKIKNEPITNNIAELKACIMAIKIVLVSINIPNNNFNINSETPIDIEIYTDSEYVINSITKWAKLWKFNGWKKKTSGKLVDIKNKDQRKRKAKRKIKKLKRKIKNYILL